MIKIQKCKATFAREPLVSPFGFKGGYLTGLWQSVVCLEADGITAHAPATQSVLWSDAKVFAAFPGEKADELMYKVTAFACARVVGLEFETPDTVVEEIFTDVKKYADETVGFPVEETFVLNSMVGLDIALWTVYCRKNGIKTFKDALPDYAKSALSGDNKSLAKIPLVSYGVTEDLIKSLADSGTALMKIKIGAPTGLTPNSEEDMAEMVKKDIARISKIHSLVKDHQTPLTKSGRVIYYLDANGRYDSAQRLEQLFEGIEKMGASDRIALIEEPFTPEKEIYVGDYPYVLNADESAHSVKDVQKRISLGYKAVALKPIAKTVSVSLKMAAEAYKNNCGVLCADLTVNPYLAEWNKQFAALTLPLKSMNVGCIEVNGDTNYTNWKEMQSLIPQGYPQKEAEKGSFKADNEFYDSFERLVTENGYKKYFD